MRPLPETENTLLVRTDFSIDGIWEKVCAEARQMDPDVRKALEYSDECNRAMGRPPKRPIKDFGTPLHLVDDRAYADASCEQLLSSLPSDSIHGFFFIADKVCMQHSDHPLMVVDSYHERGRMFRAIPSQIFGIQSNLSLANMDWEEFADNVDDDGVFRGFR